MLTNGSDQKLLGGRYWVRRGGGSLMGGSEKS